MTQQKIDDLFSQKSSKKRSRITTNDRDEFDDLFETTSSMKRIRTNNNNSNNIKQTTTTSDVFDFDIPSTSKTKRIHNDIDENKAIDDLFNNDTRKKLRRPIKTEQTPDVFDMFNIPSKSDDFKIPITQKKKIKTFFDNTDLTSIREENDTVRLKILSKNHFKIFISIERIYSSKTCTNHKWTMVIKRS